MRIFALSPGELDENLPDFEEILKRIEEHGDVAVDLVRKNTRDANMQVFGVQDHERVTGVLLTEIVETPAGRICSIIAANGSAPRGTQDRLLDEVGKWAASVGCESIRMHGRRGWLRRFKRFQQIGVVAEWRLGRTH